MNISVKNEWFKAAKLLPSDAERWQFISACIEYSQNGTEPDLNTVSRSVMDLFEIFRSGIKKAAANRHRVKKHRNITRSITSNVTSNVTCNATSNVTCTQKEKSPTPPKEKTKKSCTDVQPKESGALSFDHLIPPQLRTEEFQSAWNNWCKFRKEIKHRLTDSTAERQLQKLGRYPPKVAVAAIDESIEKGWMGLFPEKVSGPSQPTRQRDYTGV